jgi:EmrB/QacA subfamily drug resistance transporter
LSVRWVTVIILLFASFLDLLDTTIVNVALPSIQKDLNATSSQLEWSVAGYVLTFAVVLITGGRLGDRFGRKTIFIVGVAGFTVASIVCAFAQTGDTLVVSRLVQGAFSGLMVPQVLSIIQVLFKPKERASVFGAVGAITGMAAVAGPLIGGWLVSADVLGLGWRTIFIINVPIGILLLLASILFVPNSKSEKPVRLDIFGLVLISAALFMLVYALIQGRELGWPVWIWIMIVASPVLIGFFVWLQRRQDRTTGSALIPPSLFASRGYSAGVITIFAASASIGAFFLILALYLQAGLGFSAIDAGLATLPFSIGALVGSGIAVPLAARLGKFLILIGALFQVAGYLWVAREVLDQAEGLTGADLIWPMAVAGIGLTLVFVPLNDVALAQTRVENAGAASGVLNTFQQVGGALGVAVIGVVFFGIAGGNFSPTNLRDAFSAAIWVSLIAVVLTGLSSFLLPSVSQVAAHKRAAESMAE